MSDSIAACEERKSGKRTGKKSRASMQELNGVNEIGVTEKEKQKVVSLLFCFFYSV
jgi:hypothetical protein